MLERNIFLLLQSILQNRVGAHSLVINSIMSILRDKFKFQFFNILENFSSTEK